MLTRFIKVEPEDSLRFTNMKSHYDKLQGNFFKNIGIVSMM